MANVEIKINAKDNASREIKAVGDQLGMTSQQMKIASAAMIAGGAAIATGLGFAVKAAAAEEVAIKRLSVAMKNVGISYGRSRESLEDWIDTQQQKSAIDDTTIRESLSTLITMTGDLTQSQNLLNLAMDIAAGTGKDLTSVTSTLGYALAGNWGMVNRMIPALAKVADGEEKWIMLRQMFVDQAEEYGKTVEGQFGIIKNNIGDIQEAIGGVVSQQIQPMVGGINDLVQAMKGADGETLRLVVTMTEATAGALLLVGGLAGLKVAITAIAGALTVALGPLSLLVAGIATLGAGIALYIQNKQEQAKIEEAYQKALKGEYQDLYDILKAKKDLTAEEKKWIEQIDEYNKYLEEQNKLLEEQKRAITELTQAQKILLGLTSLGSGTAAGGTGKQQQAFEDMYGKVWSTFATTPEEEAARTRGIAAYLVGKNPGGIPEGVIQNTPGTEGLRRLINDALPKYQDGGYVPETGPAILHKGETVLPPGESRNQVIQLVVDGRTLAEVVAPSLGDMYTRRSHMGG